ncbi:MAG: DUF599 domain-containing protein [Bauldia sp.]|nr:MAG: DUF599 domain-containing protein [Bauldia sp.]
MSPFSTLDLVALAWFIVAWAAYAITLELTPYGRDGLNARMNRYREVWMREMLGREMRIVDTQIMAALQNGTAFFASTSLLAIGGALTLVRSTSEVLSVVATLPLGIRTTPEQWEIKAIGLAVIFVYAFFKFAWSYRLFNYVAILLGATPPADQKDTAKAQAHALRTARLFESAGRHFNRGQRAFFFALAYLGWFISPWLFLIATAAVLTVMWRRQYVSDSAAAVGAGRVRVAVPARATRGHCTEPPPEIQAGGGLPGEIESSRRRLAGANFRFLCSPVRTVAARGSSAIIRRRRRELWFRRR